MGEPGEGLNRKKAGSSRQFPERNFWFQRLSEAWMWSVWSLKKEP